VGTSSGQAPVPRGSSSKETKLQLGRAELHSYVEPTKVRMRKGLGVERVQLYGTIRSYNFFARWGVPRPDRRLCSQRRMSSE
jgi:hypothetical protein